jgi:PEP-CTERM motif
MKKITLILTAAICLLAYQAFAQSPTISITGTNVTIGAASGSTTSSQMSVVINGTNSIGNISSANLLIGTPSTGVNSGASLFNVYVSSLVSPFNNQNSTSSSSNRSTFTTAGDTANTGHTISTPTNLDLGANTTSPVTVNSSGTTTIPFDVITFTSLSALTPGTVYDFFATAGGAHDAGGQGSWVDNSSNTTFDLNSEPLFTVTVVPEPATLSLLGLSALGSLGLNVLRRRRALR